MSAMTDIRFETDAASYGGVFVDRQARRTALILPDWRGYQTAYAMRRGIEIADAHGCNVVVSDFYGEAYRPREYGGDAEIWIARALGDPEILRGNLSTYISALCETLSITPRSLHVVGYCLGGALSFEMGRADADLAAVASVHGIPSSRKPITMLASDTRFVAIHGASDPIIGMEHITAFQTEMTEAGVDWISLALGHARHGFTNEEIDPHGQAQRFDAGAARHCLNGLQSFLYTEATP
ncbi:hypothetical protein D9R08_07740 [Rhodophyticola porphyridii]|uniref:Dienelactone hydrolase domain-containing protein n=2 Tax=Rhodophyticola porphyridii TaxID=1852017 RepID=A0A3L9Y9C9_9RHOB|nr:hypothetical protein D9R08_07740 [Rhodophyticola porphyridii]